MPQSSKAPPPPPEPDYNEIIQNDVARIKRLLGLDVNRLAIGSEIEGIVEGGVFGSNDYTVTGAGTIEFVNVASDIVYGTQTGATDTVAPNQVLGLNVTPISNTVLSLTWSANTELDLSLYNVYRGTAPGFTVILGTTTPIGTPSTNSYSDTGRTTSTVYYYKVAAVDTSGNIGILSTEDSATTFPLPPAQITGLTVTPVSSTQLNLAWTAASPTNFNYYNVYRGPTGFTPGPSFRIAQPTTNSYANTGLSSGTAYYYKVAAVDTSPQEGPASAQVSGTTTGVSNPANLWLKFDGNYNDSSPFGNTVTSFNSSGFVGSGMFGGNSVKLNTPTAGTDHVEVTNNTNIAIDMAGKWSFSCWIYSTATNGMFLSKFQSTNNFTSALVYFGDLHFGVTEAGTSFGKQSGTSGSTLTLNTWHHIVGTWDGTTNTIMLYLDKVSQTSTFTGGIVITNTNLMLGGYLDVVPSRGGEFTGRIDEFQLFKGTVLTQTQVNNLYATNSP